MYGCGILIIGREKINFNTHHIANTNLVNGRPVYFLKN
jgi:hypothetical protein